MVSQLTWSHSGSLNEIGTVTVGGGAATFDTRNSNFVGHAQILVGTNILAVVATDYSNNRATNRYQLVATNNGIAQTLVYDLNGNVTQCFTTTYTNTFEWDGADRLVTSELQEAGMPTRRSEFTYDGIGRRVRIIDKTNGITLKDNRFVWCGHRLCEQRDTASGSIYRRCFKTGEQILGTNYYSTRDHLGSIREMLNSVQVVSARREYAAFGVTKTLLETVQAHFGFTGYFAEDILQDYFALYRAYRPSLGRWLNRDPLQEVAGLNRYSYSSNDPVNRRDPLGLSDNNRPPVAVFEPSSGVPPIYGPPRPEPAINIPSAGDLVVSSIGGFIEDHGIAGFQIEGGGPVLVCVNATTSFQGDSGEISLGIGGGVNVTAGVGLQFQAGKPGGLGVTITAGGGKGCSAAGSFTISENGVSLQILVGVGGGVAGGITVGMSGPQK